MPAQKPYPSADYFAEFLEYHPDTGVFIWKDRARHHFASQRAFSIFAKRDAGKQAGCATAKGYVYIGIRPRKYLAHRVAMIMSGHDVGGMLVDHINGNPSDNRLCNLRLADHSTNGRNGRMRSTNTSGVSGVCWDRSAGKWLARVYIAPYESKTLGAFKDLGDAREAVNAARGGLGYTDRHGLKSE